MLGTVLVVVVCESSEQKRKLCMKMCAFVSCVIFLLCGAFNSQHAVLSIRKKRRKKKKSHYLDKNNAKGHLNYFVFQM